MLDKIIVPDEEAAEIHELVKIAKEKRFGYITDKEASFIMKLGDTYGWEEMIVRLSSGCRFITPLRYLNDLVKTVVKGGDFVRDASFLKSNLPE